MLGVNPIPRGREVLVLNALLILSGIAVVATLYPVLFSPLGPIDDHEYLKYRFLNPTGDVMLGARQGLDRAWEEFTNEGRVRPLYQLGRTVSTSLIAVNAPIRYAFRLVTAIGVVLALSKYAMKQNSPYPLMVHQRLLLGATCTALSLTLLPWADVVGRLGPPDILGILGLLIAGTAFENHSWPRLARQNEQPRRAYMVFLFGLLLAAGSRESYAIHAAIIALAAIALIVRSRISTGRTIMATLVLIAFFPTTALLALRARGGRDFYGGSRTVGGSLDLFIDFLSSDLFIRFAPIVALWFFLTESSKRVFVCWQALIGIGMMGADYVQYSTALTTYGRYRFISDLCFVLASLGALKALLLIPSRFNFRARFWWTFRACTAIVLAALLSKAALGLQDVHAQFQYARRLNLGFSLVVEDLLEHVEESQADSVSIIIDPDSQSYRAHDLQERSLGLYWFLRYSITTTVKVDRFAVSGSYNGYSKNTFCIFLGSSPPSSLESKLRCESQVKLY
jgi:hypothetical protein